MPKRKPVVTLGGELSKRLKKFNADLKSGKPIKATRVRITQGKVTLRTKRKSARKPEAVRAWGWREEDGSLRNYAEHFIASGNGRPIRVMILRESDYRELLRYARRAGYGEK